MSQRQEEMREYAQKELYSELGTRSQPLRDQITALERQRAAIDQQIADLQQQIKDIYDPHREFLTRL